MQANLFSPMRDYPAMLAKIALFTFGVALACILLLQWSFPGFQAATERFARNIEFAGVQLPLGASVLAFVVAFVARVTKLHDVIAGLLGIRQQFDVDNILLPLALGARVDLSPDQIRRIKRERKSIMTKVFYCYASSTQGQAKIDRHYITLALDQWFWCWVLLESSFLLCLTAIILAAGKHFDKAFFLVSLVLAFAVVIRVTYSERATYALDEVQQILADEDRTTQIAKSFHSAV